MTVDELIEALSPESSLHDYSGRMVMSDGTVYGAHVPQDECPACVFRAWLIAHREED